MVTTEEKAVKDEIIEIGKKLYQLRLVLSSGREFKCKTRQI